MKQKTNSKEKTKAFEISVTASAFGSLENFYKKFAKGNRKINIENIEFEGSKEQHNTGYIVDTIVCAPIKLKTEVRKFIKENGLVNECFTVTLKVGKKTLMTEDDL